MRRAKRVPHDETLHIRITKAFRAELAAEAGSEQNHLSALIRRLLARGLAAERRARGEV
jgi:hypothetical protein